MTRIANAYSIYGIQKIKVAPSEDSLMVEYDATRLRPAEVHAALTRVGIPVALK
jgi:allophanate hydrolase subunit 1